MGAERATGRCRELLLEISQYLDGELPPSRRKKVEAHIASCSCCRTMDVRLRTVIAACRAEGRTPPPRAITARAAERIRELLAIEADGLRESARKRSGPRAARSAPRSRREHRG